VAESLLSTAPNVWLTANIHLNRSAICLVQCDFNRSLASIHAGRELAVRVGDKRAVSMFDTNSAHIEMAVGHFDRARKIFTRLLDSPEVSSVTLLGVIDGLARLELTLGRFDECESALQRFDHCVEERPSLSTNYSARWAEVTKIRLLIRRDRCEEALDHIDRLEKAIPTASDEPLRAILGLLCAHAAVRVGADHRGANSIFAASQAGITGFRELQHEYYARVAEIVGARTRLGTKMAARATRLEKYLGMFHSPVPVGNGHESNRREPWKTEVQPNELLDSCAALTDVAFSARLLGSELVQLLRGLGLTEVELVERATDKHPEVSEREHPIFDLGNDRGKDLSVQCAPPSDPLKALLLGDVFRIARGALALERFREEERNRAALWPADPVETEAGALFLSEEMQAALKTARQVAASNIPVLITGETGTGKEVLARLIHAYSPRARATFMPFNCTATPRDMLDSQLFGHRRGSFTGATDHFPGVIRAANGGTLFLDEIGETTLDVQPKLLRFLESSEVHPIGETHPTKVDVRVIAATNANLDALIAQGRFREDLLYRLNTVRVHLPPLRERRVEIPALATHYLRKYATENHKGDLRLAEDTMEYLVLYRWPGNVRQLANEMRRLAALAEKSAVLMPEHLSPDLAASRRTVPPSQRALDDNEVVVRVDQPMPAGVSYLEQRMIEYAMKKCGGRLEETASMLGLSRKGLYLKRMRYGLETPGEPPAGA
jgi:DNA-binding NtrC family response regulator